MFQAMINMFVNLRGEGPINFPSRDPTSATRHRGQGQDDVWVKISKPGGAKTLWYGLINHHVVIEAANIVQWITKKKQQNTLEKVFVEIKSD